MRLSDQVSTNRAERVERCHSLSEDDVVKLLQRELVVELGVGVATEPLELEAA
jgi:hypothetical protein